MSGKIKDKQKILFHAVSTGKVPDYLFDKTVLNSLYIDGFLGAPHPVGDFHVYPITEKGRLAFSRGKL